MWSAVRIPSMRPTWPNAPAPNFFGARGEHFAPRRFPDSLGWSGHQIMKLPAEYAVGIGKIEHDAHVVEIRNREQFGTFVPGTQQLT